MHMNRGFLLVLLFALATFAQSSSYIELYDSVGNQKTGTLGWKGNATDGSFFILGQNKETTIKNGTLTTEKFVGDGSGLTNLPAQSPAVADVRGLSDSLKSKASTAHTHTSSQITDSIRASQIQYGQFMINAAGDSGQVWKSDGNGRGYWGSDNTSSGTGTGGPVSWTDVTGKPSTFNPSAHTHPKAEISDMPIRSGDLGDTAVSTAKIKDGAVSTAKIAANTIDSTRIGNNAVTTNEIANGTITAADINASGFFSGTGSASTASRSDHRHSVLDISNPAGGNFDRAAPNSGWYLKSSWSTYAITIDAPSDGYVLVFASGKAVFWNTFNKTDGPVTAQFEIVNGSTSGIVDGQTYNFRLKQMGDEEYFSLHRGFPVTSGPNTFSIAYRCEQTDKTDYAKADDLMLSAIFFAKRM